MGVRIGTLRRCQVMNRSKCPTCGPIFMRIDSSIYLKTGSLEEVSLFVHEHRHQTS